MCPRSPRPKRTSSPAATCRGRNSASISSCRTVGASARGAPLGARQRSALVSEAAVFRLGRRLGLVFVLLRPSARDGVIGARPQIDEYVPYVAHDVRIGAERRHDALLRRVDVLAPVDDNIGEVDIVFRLQVIAEWRCVARSFAVGTVTDMAIRVIAAES